MSDREGGGGGQCSTGMVGRNVLGIKDLIDNGVGVTEFEMP